MLLYPTKAAPTIRSVGMELISFFFLQHTEMLKYHSPFEGEIPCVKKPKLDMSRSWCSRHSICHTMQFTGWEWRFSE